MKKVEMFGMDFIAAESHEDIISAIINGTISNDCAPLLITPNVDQLVHLNRPEMRETFDRLQKASYILPDGQPIVWASKLKYGRDGLVQRLTGADLFPPLWEVLIAKQKKVFFIVASKEIGIGLQSEYEQCEYFSPPYFSLDDTSKYGSVLAECKERIENFGPSHVMIGLGFPKQERIALNLIDSIKSNEILYYLLGATFEFHLGIKGRAPIWMRRSGLEFLHRMISEPRRLFKRYMIDDLAFIPLLFKELRK